MARDLLTDEQVDREIERLRDSKYVHLAQKEQRLKARRRKYMYDLRWLEKRGKQLEEMGVTDETIGRLYDEIEDITDETV